MLKFVCFLHQVAQRISWSFSAFFITCLLVVLPVKASEIALGYFHAPPYAYHRDGQPPKGIVIDLMSEILQRNNQAYAFTHLPPKRLFYCVAKGVDCQFQFLPKGLAQFDEATLMGDELVFSAELTLYFHDSVEKVASIEQLAGKRIILLRGYHYNGLKEQVLNLQPTPSVIYARDTQAAMQLLKKQRADYLLQYAQVVTYTDPDVAATFLSHKISKTDYYLSIHRSVENAEQRLAQFTETLKVMKKNGLIEDVFRRNLAEVGKH